MRVGVRVGGQYEVILHEGTLRPDEGLENERNYRKNGLTGGTSSLSSPVRFRLRDGRRLGIEGVGMEVCTFSMVCAAELGLEVSDHNVVGSS